MTTHSKAGVVVTPNVECRRCNVQMGKRDGFYRHFKCPECGRIVSVNGEYDVIRIPDKEIDTET